MELRQEQLAKQAQIDRMNQRYVASINVHDKELLSDVHTVMHVAHGIMDPLENMQHMEERFKTVYALAMENDASLAEALYMAAGTAAADYVGVTSLYEAKIGEDLLTGRKLSSGERWFRGITGGISLVTTAMGIGRGLGTIANGVRSLGMAGRSARMTRLTQLSCNGGRICWLAGTELVADPRLTSLLAPNSVTAGKPDDPSEEAGWNLPVLGGATGAVLIAIAGLALPKRRRRRTSKKADCPLPNSPLDFLREDYLEELLKPDWLKAVDELADVLQGKADVDCRLFGDLRLA